ncbi:MAG: hypothetical protein R2795_04535 [Saprospiraceae bacterium]
MIFPAIHSLIAACKAESVDIPADRKELLERIAAYIREHASNGHPIRLVFICTHNSRRSHFGQIAAAVAAAYYGVSGVEVFSGGTEATAFHPHAIAALRELGFVITTPTPDVDNPVWSVHFGEQAATQCFFQSF